MSTRILVTTTSFQDTPGSHHTLLAETGWEIVTARGPLNETELSEVIDNIDGVICGDDAFTAAILERGHPRLRVVSKYGIGVDKIDVAAAARLGIPVCYTPGVNHTTVAEHTFALLLALQKNLVAEVNSTRSGRWERLTGHEIHGSTIGIVGLGRIGREVALRARAFGLSVIAVDTYWPEEFAAKHQIERCDEIDALLRRAEIVSLHTNLTDDTRELINTARLALMKRGAILLNCARGELVDTDAVVAALHEGHLAGYGTDVLDVEPPPADHPLLAAPRCIVTPHIASRTYESVVRQATKAVQNLILAMEGKEPLAKVTPG
ncbi:MAG: phosphoglycerate dehydrogenase [Spirochaeta sp.]|jgi:D-3-phosphoglycerate dehydrogenase|nr:phosphoglycerate dehydrogenase [Spirochaeta sp.]